MRARGFAQGVVALRMLEPSGLLTCLPTGSRLGRCSEAAHWAQPGPWLPSTGSAFCDFSCFSLLFLFPFLLFSLSYFYSPLFSFSLTFIFLSSLDYSHSFSPCFIVILYISLTLTS